MSNKVVIPQQSLTIKQIIADRISIWRDNVTRPETERRQELLNFKGNLVLDFFDYVAGLSKREKTPRQITEKDVKLFQDKLEGNGLAHSTIYNRMAQLSSFFGWLAERKEIDKNPVVLPRAPRAYQNEKAQALSDGDVKAILAVVKEKDTIVGKRDYALLLLYFLTGKRRQEIIRLRRKDIRINGALTITYKLKGSDYIQRELKAPVAKAALLDYIQASGREWDKMDPNERLWLAHDRSGQNTGKPISSHGFVKNCKRYAKLAGVGDFHLHQTRHTAANWAESDNEAQDLLDHKNPQTTKIYRQRVRIKKDKFSNRIADRLELQ